MSPNTCTHQITKTSKANTVSISSTFPAKTQLQEPAVLGSAVPSRRWTEGSSLPEG